MKGLESVAAQVSIAWGRPGWELRVGGLGLLITGFPRYQCSDWCHSSFLTHLPLSLGGSLACAISRTLRLGIWLPCSETQPSLWDSHDRFRWWERPRWSSGEGSGQTGEPGGRETSGGDVGRWVRPQALWPQGCAALRPPGKCVCCPTGQVKTPMCVSRQLRCRGPHSLIA